MVLRFAAMVIMLGCFNAAEAMPKQEKTFKDWTVFTVMQDGDKVCYMTSTPTKEEGNYKRRGEPYLLVTYRGKGLSEVSVSSGYPYKKGSEVKVKIDQRLSKDLFTSEDTPRIAWAKTSDDDKSIVANMKKGFKLTARGTSQLGTYSEDTYSLSGFTNAHKHMVSLCN